MTRKLFVEDILRGVIMVNNDNNEELIRMIKLRIQGLPDEVEKFSEQLKKDGYHFLMESDDYPNRNSVYVRKYVDIRLKEQE